MVEREGLLQQAAAGRDQVQSLTGCLLGIFQLFEPSRARGQRVAADQADELSTRQLKIQFKPQPAVQATLLATLRWVNDSLGLRGRSHEPHEWAEACQRNYAQTEALAARLPSLKQGLEVLQDDSSTARRLGELFELAK